MWLADRLREALVHLIIFGMISCIWAVGYCQSTAYEAEQEQLRADQPAEVFLASYWPERAPEPASQALIADNR